MAAPADYPQTPAESLISLTIRSTWLLWLVGGLYIAGPALGWVLAAMAAWALYTAPARPEGQRARAPGGAALLWLAGMAAMLVILWIGHATHALGMAATIKSSIGWAKGWALIALFPLAGAILPIRLSVIAEAVCRLGVQTLWLLPVFLAAPMLGLPQTLWVSPLSVIGGSGPEYFATTLYTIEPGVGTARWQFFAPWSPAAGMVAVLNVILALRERSRGLRAAGIAGWILVALLSQSRLALVALLAILPVLWAMRHAARPWLWLAAVPAMLCAGIFGGALIEWAGQVMDQLQGARADSTRVRAALGRIAVERWQNEAPWFGHGVVEAGPHLVEYMPIGSHHSWYGLLFVKGLTGALALAIPLAVTAAVLGKAALGSAAGRCGFGLVLAMVLYSFGENLEMLAYLCWPAWLAIGVALASPPYNDQAKA